jgi:hypothetical protein
MRCSASRASGDFLATSRFAAACCLATRRSTATVSLGSSLWVPRRAGVRARANGEEVTISAVAVRRFHSSGPISSIASKVMPRKLTYLPPAALSHGHTGMLEFCFSLKRSVGLWVAA